MQLHNATVTIVDRNGHSQQKSVDLSKNDFWAGADSVAFQMHNRDDYAILNLPADIGGINFVNNAGGAESIGLLPVEVDGKHEYVSIGSEVKNANGGDAVRINYPPGRTGVVTVTLARKTALAPTTSEKDAAKAATPPHVDLRIVTTFDVETHNGVLHSPTSGAAIFADGTDKVATFKDRSEGDVIFFDNDMTRSDQQFTTLKQKDGNMAPIIYGFCDAKDLSRVNVQDPPRAAFIGQQGQIQCYEHPHGNFCNADDAKFCYVAWIGAIDAKHPAAATLVEGEK